MLLHLCKIFPSLPFYINALELMEACQYSWYDTLIITAAIDSHCSFHYSEDLQHGQRIKDLLILNPFA